MNFLMYILVYFIAMIFIMIIMIEDEKKANHLTVVYLFKQSAVLNNSNLQVLTEKVNHKSFPIYIWIIHMIDEQQIKKIVCFFMYVCDRFVYTKNQRSTWWW